MSITPSNSGSTLCRRGSEPKDLGIVLSQRTRSNDDDDYSSQESRDGSNNNNNIQLRSQHDYKPNDASSSHIRQFSHGSFPPRGNHHHHGGGGPEPKLTPRRFMAFVAMSFLWTASQIPVYLYGGIPTKIYASIGGSETWIWFITANLLGSAAICPFSGALSDLLGRRWVALGGISSVIVGQIVCATAINMGSFISGMTISGVGAGINELTALAGTAEMAPTSKRGVYVACLILTIVPFLPSVLWAQMIASSSSSATGGQEEDKGDEGWRYVGLLTTGWSFLGLLAVGFFYFPPPRINSEGLTRQEVLRRIDFVGGGLSITGIVLFTCGLLWGGYQYPWLSAHVLCPIIFGALLMTAFVCWEIWGAQHPMVPRHLGKARWDLGVTFVITFISGANFFSVLMLWPSQAENVYGHDPIGIGIRGLPFAFGVLGGAVITLYLMSRFAGQVKWLCFGSSILMTAGCGAMAAARVDNMSAVYGILFLAGLGVGGIVIPASLLSTLIVPDDVIATISSMTLAVRVIGGALGFTIYYNVFHDKLVPELVHYVGGACVKNGITDPKAIEGIVQLTGASLIENILPIVNGDMAVWTEIVGAGQVAFAAAYPWVYYCSIPFGVLSIVASLFLGDISEFMDDHVAVMIV